jgi:hypothetical protein
MHYPVKIVFRAGCQQCCNYETTASRYVSVLNKLIVTGFRLIFYDSLYGNLYKFGTEEMYQLHGMIYMKCTMAGE